MTPEEIQRANQTYRRSIGRQTPVTPRLLQELYDPSVGPILDFGAGTDAVHTVALRDAGYNVTAHDFGRNVGPLIDPLALSRQYAVVFASNVLNVQSSEEMLRATLGQIRQTMRSVALLNYPSSPRKADISSSRLLAILRETFREVSVLRPQTQTVGLKTALVMRVRL